jgi:putative addiction module component (TIGR02574 family)
MKAVVRNEAMSEAAELVFQSAMALPPEERDLLVEALIAECEHSLRRPFSEAWMVEARRRSAMDDAHPGSGSSWEEVKARVRKRVEDRVGG